MVYNIVKLCVNKKCCILFCLGPRNPVQPTSVRFTNTTHSTATIEWRMSRINYTPESYSVQYGTRSTLLELETMSIESGSDVTITNRIYSVDIRGLTFNTTYYYQVTASNSFGSTYSSVKSFVTVSLSKLVKIVDIIIIIIAKPSHV